LIMRAKCMRKPNASEAERIDNQPSPDTLGLQLNT
jgi:hypothetical protein